MCVEYCVHEVVDEVALYLVSEMTGGLWWCWQNAVIMVVVLSTTSVHCTHYTDHYAVQVDGGVDEARHVAVQHGFLFVNEVLSVVTLFAIISN